LVKNVATGLCSSDKDGSTAGNNPIVEETCSDISRMRWSFTYVSGPTTGPTGSGRTWSNTTDGFTVSWNILGDHNKTFGIGWTDNVTARMTIHHNWIHDTTQRNPSADNLQYAHLYNNYLVNITSYGNLSRGSTKMVLENSYFDHVNNPWNIDDTSKGQLKQSGSVAVSCTGAQVTGGSAFTPSSFYSYTLDAAANVPTRVKTYAGPRTDISM
jgi:pectate lyase